jgi:5-methylcytosine-specific restriction protein A
MTLGDLTDRTAVERAIAEFDQVGRDAFLAKYGFGPARKWFVESRGKRYDSKAIAGAALARLPVPRPRGSLSETLLRR